MYFGQTQNHSIPIGIRGLNARRTEISGVRGCGKR
jgi:hypothetical protein